MVELYYDSEYTDELNKRIAQKFWEENRHRDKVHLSDTCHCPVKTYCRLIGLNPIRDDNSVGIMMIGVVGQEIIQAVYPEEQREFEPDAALPEDKQLPSHIDIFADMKIPVEIKWSRKSIYRGSDIGKSWFMQITGYMAKTYSTEGKMVIFNLITGKLNAFKVIMTEEELSVRLKEIDCIVNSINESVANKDPSCLEIWSEECQYCDYREARKRKTLGLGEACPRYKDNPKPVENSQIDQYLS